MENIKCWKGNESTSERNKNTDSWRERPQARHPKHQLFLEIIRKHEKPGTKLFSIDSEKTQISTCTSQRTELKRQKSVKQDPTSLLFLFWPRASLQPCFLLKTKRSFAPHKVFGPGQHLPAITKLAITGHKWTGQRLYPLNTNLVAQTLYQNIQYKISKT